MWVISHSWLHCKVPLDEHVLYQHNKLLEMIEKINACHKWFNIFLISRPRLRGFYLILWKQTAALIYLWGPGWALKQQELKSLSSQQIHHNFKLEFIYYLCKIICYQLKCDRFMLLMGHFIFIYISLGQMNPFNMICVCIKNILTIKIKLKSLTLTEYPTKQMKRQRLFRFHWTEPRSFGGKVGRPLMRRSSSVSSSFSSCLKVSWGNILLLRSGGAAPRVVGWLWPEWSFYSLFC